MRHIFHGPTLDLFGTLADSFESSDVNDGTQLPDSIAEWYARTLPAEMLRAYAHQDHPLPPVTPEHDATGRLFLPIMRENQNNYVWGALLDGHPDPPVYVRYAQQKHARWLPLK